jgi:hypothetical protein
MSQPALQHHQRCAQSALVKIRCTPDLKGRLALKAVAKESDISTIAREAFRFYLAHHDEAPLGGRLGVR